MSGKLTFEDGGPRGRMKDSGSTAAELDASRRRNMAYEYLCHLEEARKWLEACLGSDLPPASEIEGALRNGVIVAKLSMFFAPDLVKPKHIYDMDEKIYQERGLVFRHTDNIAQWLRAMKSVKFPEIFYPEVTDLYDKKNMPRVIYCVHALSRYLFHLGIAPEIEDLHGIAQFTEEEISAIDKELQKSGVQMPKFGKIGGILAKELGEDDAAMHAAVLKINQLLEEKASAADLFKALQHPAAGIKKAEEDNAATYRDALIAAREEKAAAAPAAIEGKERDVYDTNLTKAEIQKTLNVINAHIAAEAKAAATAAALMEITLAVDISDKDMLTDRLQAPAAEIGDVDAAAGEFYLANLKAVQRQQGEPFTQGQVQDGVDHGNAAYQQQQRVEQAVTDIVAAAKGNDASLTLASLKKGSQLLQLPALTDTAADRYHSALHALAAQGKPLSADDVGHSVADVNADLDREAVFSAALKQANDAIAGDDANAMLLALNHEALELHDVDEAGAFMYHKVLQEALQAAGRELTRDEIQEQVTAANVAAEENAKHAEAMFALNEAIRSGESQRTLTALKDPYTHVESVEDKCELRYQDALGIALKNKERMTGGTGSKWRKYSTDDGRAYYYNKESKETQWIPPADMSDPLLTAEETQEIVVRCNADQTRWEQFQAAEPTIVELQARVRGLLARKSFTDRMQFLKSQQEAVVKLQAAVRGMQQKKKYQDRVNFLRAHANVAIKLQAAWKGIKARREYNNLTKVTNPPVVTVRKFLHLLDQSDLDFEEEMKVQQLKERVVKEIKENKQLETDLNEMDIKIGLLVRNRIELQDVVKQHKKLKKRGVQAPDIPGSSFSLSTPGAVLAAQGLKSLNKEARERLESYQHLFYLLQTHPVYLARLVFIEQPLERWTSAKAQTFLNHLIETVYNYASNAREKYLLMKLFRTALSYEVKEKVEQPKDFITGNPTVIKLVVNHHRGSGSGNYLKEVLEPGVQSIMREEMDLNADPRDIYRRWVGKQEAETGQKSELPYDVPREEALTHEHVRDVVQKITERLLDITRMFLDTIVSKLKSLPFGLRYICHSLKKDLREKFPDVHEDEITKVLGNILYYRYFMPAIIAPDAFDVIQSDVNNQLSNNARKSLANVAKKLHEAASGQVYDEGTLEGKFMAESWQKFKRYVEEAADVESLESYYNIDEYSDVVMLTKPVVYISPAEIFYTHDMLATNVDRIAPEQDDPLRAILTDLGMVGAESVVLGEENSPQLAASKQAISLTLSNKFEVPEGDDSDVKTMFLRTKKMVIEAIRFQQGKNLRDILENEPTAEEEEEYNKWVKEKAEKKDPAQFSDLRELKKKTLEQCAALEQAGRCAKDNNYQDILNAIAQDIRNQRIYRRQRKQELTKLQVTLEELAKKRTFFSEQSDYYDQYVDSCMQQMSKGKGKKQGALFRFLRRKKDEEKEEGWVPGRSVKYSAAKLKEKGVIISVDGIADDKLKLVSLEIVSRDEVGVFEVKVSAMMMHKDNAELIFQDLLQMQYENIPTTKLFDICTISVNLLIFLINKKFYGK
eukprot:m.257054 g.257054  ORF g.257054 m.257054 type:complete len:1548 (+) comp22704_c2_seq1:460-5103(+)